MFGAPGSLRRSKNQRLFLLPAESEVTRGTVNLPQLRFTAGAFGFLTLTQYAERLGERIKKESCYFID
jgi:hypothetical protein